MDERIQAPPSVRIWHARKLWLGTAVIAFAAAIITAAALRTGSNKLMLTPGLARAQAAHGTWRHMFDLHGIAASIPLPLWILALVCVGVLGLPYTWLVARSLPDRGYALSRGVGILLVTWIVWWLGSVRLLPFTRAAIWVAFGLVGAGAVCIFVRHRVEMLAWVRANKRLLLVAEAVFWGVFALALLVRWSNPDLWHPVRGGEKPMDFAYLNAVIKSSYFPPYDPWFAGGQMNYYYFGFVQIAALIKVTGIPPAIAYNLAIPTLAGLLASGVFSAALGLGSFGRPTRRWRPVGFATLAALLVTVFGDLGEIRVLQSWLHRQIPIEWWYWNPTRVIHPSKGEPGPISEFPAFTYIYGDLHAHAMALPLAALALALIVATVRERLVVRAGWPRLALLGLVLGALSVTNTWDLPTYALLAVCALAIAALGMPRSLRTLTSLGAAVVGISLVAYVAFLPYHLHYWSVFEGVERWRGRRTRLNDYLTIHGLFLFAIASALIVQIAFAEDLGGVARTYRLALRNWDRYGRFRDLRRALVRDGLQRRLALWLVPAAVAFAVICGALGSWPTAVAVVIALLAVLAWPVRQRGAEAAPGQSLRRLVIVFTVVGLALTIAVEFYVLRLIDIGRTNTVFKLYLQVWVIWGLAAAVSAGVVYEHLGRVRRSLREGWRLGFVLILVVAGLYPILAARARMGDRFDTSVGPTLDGTAFMRKAVFFDRGATIPLKYDLAAIQWMQERVNGSPVVAEANTAPVLYGWELRYAMFTGNPAIVGWDYHQRQQRPPQSAVVEERVADVQKAYNTTDAAVAFHILSRYKASYVVVGPLERAYFPHGIAKWSQGAGRYWTLAYSNPGVQIYRLGEAVPAQGP